MNGREVLSAVYAGERTDRLPYCGISAWAETVERWRAEGCPAAEGHQRSLGLASDDWLRLPLDLNMVPAFPVRMLAMDERYVTLVDEFGVTKKMLRSEYERNGGYKTAAGAMSAMAQWIDFPVKDLRSWKALQEERFRPDLAGRLPNDWENRKPSHVAAAETRWVTFSCFPLFGLFGPLRELMGLEGLLFAMMDTPDLVHAMVNDLTDFWLAVFAKLLPEVRLDQITFFEDMCAAKAPIIGPALFREFLAPGYRKTVGGLREMGVSQFILDTDGNAWDIIPDMLACGITGTHPCEVHPGMDPRALREAFPRLCMSGGIAKGALARGPREIDAEVERRFRLAWESGRYTPALDHGAPPDISWANMRHFAARYRELCAAPPRSAPP